MPPENGILEKLHDLAKEVAKAIVEREFKALVCDGKKGRGIGAILTALEMVEAKAPVAIIGGKKRRRLFLSEIARLFPEKTVVILDENAARLIPNPEEMDQLEKDAITDSASAIALRHNKERFERLPEADFILFCREDFPRLRRVLQGVKNIVMDSCHIDAKYDDIDKEREFIRQASRVVWITAYPSRKFVEKRPIALYHVLDGIRPWCMGTFRKFTSRFCERIKNEYGSSWKTKDAGKLETEVKSFFLESFDAGDPDDRPIETAEDMDFVIDSQDFDLKEAEPVDRRIEMDRHIAESMKNPAYALEIEERYEEDD